MDGGPYRVFPGRAWAGPGGLLRTAVDPWARTGPGRPHASVRATRTGLAEWRGRRPGGHPRPGPVLGGSLEYALANEYE